MGRISLAALAAGVALAVAAPAQAAPPTSIFGGAVPCTTDADGITACQGDASHRVLSFDGAPIDVNVTIPKGTGPFPIIGSFHGWGGAKIGIGTLKEWSKAGYAMFSMSDRGWGESCGGQDSRFDAACTNGYNHLMDTRYEVRDAQELIGRLADEGIAHPQKVGSMGGSYGGGLSMALGALRTRIMLPDGSYAPWKSPAGKPMKIAAATPEIPWTDLAYSLVPTGRTLDYLVDNPYGARGGIMKSSFVAGLFALGAAGSYYANPGQDEDADLFRWYALTNAGEPYDDNPLLLDAVDELTTHHSSYYIDRSVTPAPMLINNGFTDDLFPPDEAVRYYNKARASDPRAKISLFFLDNGHQRGQNKAGEVKYLRDAQRQWFDYYLQGKGDEPFQGARAITIGCGDNKALGPYSAKNWRSISPGEVRLSSAAAQTIVSGGDPRRGQAYDPIAGGGACATAEASDQTGTASYRLPAAGAQEFTVLGSPTVIADIDAPSPHAQVAARLLDIDPATNTAALMARGVYRPDASGRQVFQLHPTGWHVRSGHVVKLELLAYDAPYARPSNGAGPVTISNLELRLPTAEKPGGVISEPAKKFVPAGGQLVRDYASSSRKAKTKQHARKRTSRKRSR